MTNVQNILYWLKDIILSISYVVNFLFTPVEISAFDVSIAPIYIISGSGLIILATVVIARSIL